MKMEKGDLLVPFSIIVVYGLTLCIGFYTKYNFVNFFDHFVGLICLSLVLVIYLIFLYLKNPPECPRPEFPKDKKKIKLLTYNIFLRPPLVKKIMVRIIKKCV